MRPAAFLIALLVLPTVLGPVVLAAEAGTSSSTTTTTIEVPSWLGQAYGWVLERSGRRWGQFKVLGVWLMEKGQVALDKQTEIRAWAGEKLGALLKKIQGFLGWNQSNAPPEE